MYKIINVNKMKLPEKFAEWNMAWSEHNSINPGIHIINLNSEMKEVNETEEKYGSVSLLRTPCPNLVILGLRNL